MDSTRDSIRRILLGLLACFFLSAQECTAGLLSWLWAAKSTSELMCPRAEIYEGIMRVRDDICTLEIPLEANARLEDIKGMSYEESWRIRRIVEEKKSYEYSPDDVSVRLAYSDCASLIRHMKEHIIGGNDYVAKECLMKFIESLEGAELHYGAKVLGFYKLFLKLGEFYALRLVDFGFCVRGPGPEGFCSPEAIANYHSQEGALDKAFLLTFRVVSACMYILLREIDEKGPSYEYFDRIVYKSLSYCYPLLAPFACPKFPSVSSTVPLISDTGCSGGASSGRARADTPSGYSSESISDSSEDDLDPVAGRRTSKFFSKFVPGNSLR